MYDVGYKLILKCMLFDKSECNLGVLLIRIINIKYNDR